MRVNERSRRLFFKIFFIARKRFRKKNVSTGSHGASTFSGRDNLFNGPLPRATDGAEVSCPPSMAIIALAAVGLLGGGFMLYVLLQWMRETARNRNQ
jgi:hypothetical protein